MNPYIYEQVEDLERSSTQLTVYIRAGDEIAHPEYVYIRVEQAMNACIYEQAEGLELRSTLLTVYTRAGDDSAPPKHVCIYA